MFKGSWCFVPAAFFLLETNKPKYTIMKTVKYNGQEIKINFKTANQTRIVDRMDGLRIADAHGTKDFIINGKTYKIEWTMKYKKSHSVHLHFGGFTCGDSEKKMIEHIISKFGIQTT